MHTLRTTLLLRLLLAFLAAVAPAANAVPPYASSASIDSSSSGGDGGGGGGSSVPGAAVPMLTLAGATDDETGARDGAVAREDGRDNDISGWLFGAGALITAAGSHMRWRGTRIRASPAEPAAPPGYNEYMTKKLQLWKGFETLQQHGSPLAIAVQECLNRNVSEVFLF